MSNMLDDLTLRFKSFGDTLDKSLTSIDLSFSKLQLPTLKGDAKQPAAVNESFGLQEASKVEKEAAEARAELILQQLPQGYFDHAFDPLEYELRQMGEKADQTDIDNVVDKLTAAVEVVGMRLAKHVLKEQEKLIAGITNVTQVEDDLKAAHVICQSSRAQLKMAAEEVQLQIRVITSTRRKQAYMEVLEAASKAKRVKDLPQALRKVHEAGDHGQAILLCVDCFQAVEALAAFQMASDLQTSVQQLYYDTLQRLDAALHNICSSFTGEGYTKLLEAFVLQGLPGPALAVKVLACFQVSIADAAVRLVRSMVLAKAAFSSGGGSSSPSNSGGRMGFEERSFEDLCKLLPAEMVSSCICKFLEVVFELLCSYEAMAQWHAAGLLQQDTAMVAAITAVQQQPGALSQTQLQQVHAATRTLLEAIATVLAESRGAVLDMVVTQLQVLLTAGAAKCKGDQFTQVLENCLQFISMAEAFAGCPLPARAALIAVLGCGVNGYHKANMESLKLALAVENWQPSGSVSSSAALSTPHCLDVHCMRHYLQCSPYVLPSFGDAAAVREFSMWQQAGNPFRRRARTVGGRRSLPASHGEALPEQPEQHLGAPLSGPAPATATSCRVATKSGMLVLRMLSSYAALMPLLPDTCVVLWAAVCELFDNFLLACFILFSGVSLEALVWQEDQLPHRLRSALLRITTSPGCKYKAQVEEIQTRPDTSLLASFGNSLLDFGITNSSSTTSSTSAPGTHHNNSGSNMAASNVSSKLDLFSKFKDTMVELINTDLSQPVPSSSYHLSQQTQQPQLQKADHRRHVGGQQATPSSDGSSPAAAAPGAAQTTQQQGHFGHEWALKERVVAIESLTTLADALRAAKPALLQELRKSDGSAGIVKEVEGYFARTVDAAQDLAVAIYRGGAKQLLGGVVDAAHGTAAQIAACNYNVKEPAASYQPWTAALMQHFQGFSNFLKVSNLPPDVQDKMWEAAVKLGGTAMLDGLSRVRHCTMQGRAGMSLDLSAVEKGLRTMAPAAAVSSLRLVDNYIKAFYIPWSELGRWAQIHVAEYGKGKILVLVEVMAEAYGVKRSDKSAMLDKLNTELAEFS